MAKSSSNFPIVDLKDYVIAERTVHSIQVNHVIEKQKMKSAAVEENMKKAEFNFMIDLEETLLHKTSVDPKMLQLMICLRNRQKERAPEDFSPVCGEITGRFGLLFAGDRIVVPVELKRQVVVALHSGHPSSTKMLAESNIFWWFGMKKDIEIKCGTCTACMSSGSNLKHQSRKNYWMGNINNDQELSTVLKIRSVLQIIKFFTKNYYQHQLNFRDH